MSSLKKQFYFLHIPKTAGTTFALLLARLYRRQKKISFYPVKNRQSLKPYTSEQMNGYDLFYGHYPFDANLKPERGIEYFTFLREPRELMLSAYKFLKGGNHPIKKIKGKNYSLNDFLTQGILKNFDNVMVRFLSGNLGKGYLEITEADMQTAIKNFDAHFHIFGLTEYFDESLVLLSDYMNWEPLFYARENKSAYTIDPKELDEATEKLIVQCTRFDEIVYKHAQERFLKMLSEKRQIVDAGLIELKKGNEKRKSLLLLRNKASLLISGIKQKLS